MAVKVYSKAAQKVVDVASDEAQRGLLQGDYDAIGGETIRVAKGNKTGTVGADGLITALGQGARIVDNEEAQQIQVRREESDIASQALGTAEGVASGATLGLSSLAQEALGADPKRMAARREATGVVGTGAGLVGAVVPTLLTGGAGAAATAGRAGVQAGRGLVGRALAYTPAGIVARAGARAEAAVASRLGTGVASKLVPQGTRGFIEGYGGGVGTEIDESVLGERELAADRLMSQGMAGGLFGGGVGAGVSGLASAASGAGRASARSMSKALARWTGNPSGEVAGEIAESVARAADGAVEPSWWHRAQGALTQSDPEDIARGWGLVKTRRGRDLITGRRTIGDVQEETAGSIRTLTDDANSAYAEALDGITGTQKMRKVGELLKDADGEVIDRASREVWDSARAHLRSKLDDPLARESFVTTDLRDAVGWLDRAEKEILKSVDDPKVARFNALERFKQEVDNRIQKRVKAAKGQLSPQLDDTITTLRRVLNGGEDATTGEVIGGIRPFLQDEGVWGAAGALQRSQNESLSAAMRSVDDLKAKSPEMARMFELGTPVDSASALRLARRYTRAGGEVKQNLFDDVHVKRMNALRVAKENYDLPPETLARIEKYERSVESMRKQMAAHADTADELEVVGRLRRDEGSGSPSITALSTMGPSVGTLIGSTFGPAGAAVGAMAGGITRPLTALKQVAGVLNLLEKADGGIAEAIGRIGSRMKAPRISLGSAPARVRAAAATGAASAYSRSTSRGKSDEDRQKAIDNARMYAASPDALEKALALPLRGLSKFAPGVAGLIHDRAAQAASFLASKAPKTYQSPYSSKPPMVDPVSAAAFDRYLRAVQDPIAVLGDIADGTITREQAEAIRMVYPAMYRDVQENIQQQLADAQAEGRDVPFDLRIKLGQFFDTPTDASQNPRVGAALQAASSQQPVPPPPPSQPVKSTAGAYATDAERREASLRDV